MVKMQSSDFREGNFCEVSILKEKTVYLKIREIPQLGNQWISLEYPACAYYSHS